MLFRAPPKRLLVDHFDYYERDGTNSWSEPNYKEKITVQHVRADRSVEYLQTAAGASYVYHTVVFCYNGITTPLPNFKEQSKVILDGKEHIILKVIPVKQPYVNELYSVELELV